MPAVAPLDLLGSFQTKKQQKHLACFVRTSKNSFFNKKLFFLHHFLIAAPSFWHTNSSDPFMDVLDQNRQAFLKRECRKIFDTRYSHGSISSPDFQANTLHMLAKSMR